MRANDGDELPKINKPDYDDIVFNHDPMKQKMLDAYAIVREFASEQECLVYGGVAIDYALRLKGSHIYGETEPEKVPDLDVLSPDNVNVAYMLTRLLYDKGFTYSRAITGIFATTMKVDIGDNHFIIDISYCDKKVFDAIPTLVYKGIKVVHPTWQRVDLHGALSFPFDNPPTEAIFNRWIKDIQRLQLIDEHYPIVPDNDSPVIMNKYKIKTNIMKRLGSCALGGFLAYSIYYTIYKIGRVTVDPAVVASMVTHTKSPGDGESLLEFAGPTFTSNIVDYITTLEEKVDKLAKTGKMYRALGNLIPKRVEFTEFSLVNTIYFIGPRMLGVKSVDLSLLGSSTETKKIRVVSVQYLLRSFLVRATLDAKNKNMYYKFYNSLMRMANTIDNEHAHIFYPSIDVMGDENKSIAAIVSENNIDHVVNGATVIQKAPGYRPHNEHGAPKEPPIYIYNSVLYEEDGAEIN